MGVLPRLESAITYARHEFSIFNSRLALNDLRVDILMAGLLIFLDCGEPKVVVITVLCPVGMVHLR